MKKSIYTSILIILLISQISSGSITSKIKVTKEEYEPGETVKGVLELKNPEYQGMKMNILVTYSITKNNEIITEKTATIPLGAKRIKILKLQIPEATSPGSYKFKTIIESNKGRVKSEDFFKIKGNKAYPWWIYLIPLPFGLYILYRKLKS